MNLYQAAQALRNSLSQVTNIPPELWDYWGLAPDSEFPRVGQLWPVGVDFQGSQGSVRFYCGVALWTPGKPSDLLAPLSTLVAQIQDNYGPYSPCPPSLAGFSVSLEALDIGTPSTSAASSVGPNPTGSWVSVTFTLTLTQ